MSVARRCCVCHRTGTTGFVSADGTSTSWRCADERACRWDWTIRPIAPSVPNVLDHIAEPATDANLCPRCQNSQAARLIYMRVMAADLLVRLRSSGSESNRIDTNRRHRELVDQTHRALTIVATRCHSQH